LLVPNILLEMEAQKKV